MKQKEPPATFTLRLPRDLGGQIQHRANAARMSMNAWVLRAIDMALAKGNTEFSVHQSAGDAKP